MLFEKTVYHNSVYIWLAAATITACVYFLMHLTKIIIQRRFKHWSNRTAAEWLDLMASLTEGIHPLFLLALGLYAGSLKLDLPDGTSDFITTAVTVIVLFQIALLSSRAIRFFIDRYRRKKALSNAGSATTLSLIGFMLNCVLWFILLLVALDTCGINVTALVAGLGISGIAVALAVQNVLGDLFASFSIVFDKPFVIGDFIIVGDFMGTVEYVGIKTTRVRSLSGEQLVFSNGDLLQSRIRNFKRMYERRVVFTLQVLYQTSHEQLKNIPHIIESIIEKQSQVRFDRAHFKEYGAYSLNFEIVYWVLTPDYNIYMDIQQEINLSIFEQFKEQGIQFAYPTQTLIIGNGTPSDIEASGAQPRAG